MLKYNRYGLLKLKDINTLNVRVITHLPNFNFANTIIIIQKIKLNI